MALKIIKSTDALTVEHINLCIYAQPGLGKTTLAYSAEDPLLLDFDRGAHRAANRKDTVPVASWADLADLDADAIAPYKTVIVDTAGRALDFLSADIIKANPKAGRSDGSLTLPGFGSLKSRFSTWLKTLRTYGKDVVLIAHMDEQKNGDEMIERLDVQGGSKGEIYKSVDAMGRIFIRDKKRVLDFSPRENAFGKNPANLDVLEIPHPSQNNHFLADTITLIKARMNELSAEQKKAQEDVDAWADAIRDLSNLDNFNDMLGQVKKAPSAAKALFNAAAEKCGFKFNKASGLYEAREAVHA